MSDLSTSAQTLADGVRARWSAPFLIDVGSKETWSYGDVFSAAADLADRLEAAGMAGGDRVALRLPNGIPLLVGYFGCLLGGFVAVPIHGQISDAEADYILDTTSPREVLTADEDVYGRRENGPLAAARRRAETGMAGILARFQMLDFERLLTVHFTSGTTGRPKGVCHSAGTLLRSAAAFNEALGFTEEHRFLHLLPMSYMAGFLNTVLCPLLAGASVVVGEAYHARMPLNFWAVPREYSANVLWIVPSMAAALVAIDKDAAGAEYCRTSIARVCIGTAPLPPEIGRRFLEKYGVRLLESYGLSETLFVASNSPLFPVKPGSVGRLLTGVTVRISDKTGVTLPRGSEGEIWIQNNSTTSGYFGEAAATQDARGFCSGDLGCVDADGNLFITGRQKDLIIRGGVNVSPRAIEEAIAMRDDLVKAVAVVGIPHPLKGEEIVAFLEPAAAADATSIGTDVSRYCRETLAAHQCPDRVLVIETMPMGVSGKIQKYKLREFLLGAASLAAS